MVYCAGPFVQRNCTKKEEKKNTISALNRNIFLTYSEQAKPDTNALIIISPHKGLLSQLAAQQLKISSPLFYSTKQPFSFPFALVVSVKLWMFMLPLITEDYYIHRLQEMTDKIGEKGGGGRTEGIK